MNSWVAEGDETERKERPRSSVFCQSVYHTGFQTLKQSEDAEADRMGWSGRWLGGGGGGKGDANRVSFGTQWLSSWLGGRATSPDIGVPPWRDPRYIMTEPTGCRYKLQPLYCFCCKFPGSSGPAWTCQRRLQAQWCLHRDLSLHAALSRDCTILCRARENRLARFGVSR